MNTYHSDELGEVTVPDDLVNESNACPECGERNPDYLEIIDDGERVHCLNCGMRYDLNI